jgi:hypothetical protein
MKKIICVILLITILIVSGCTNNNNDSEPNKMLSGKDNHNPVKDSDQNTNTKESNSENDDLSGNEEELIGGESNNEQNSEDSSGSNWEELLNNNPGLADSNQTAPEPTSNETESSDEIDTDSSDENNVEFDDSDYEYDEPLWTLEECEKQEDDYDKDDCYMYVAEQQKDASICDRVVIDYHKDSCLLGIALVNLDPIFCNMIENDYDRDSCITTVATDLNDPTICNKNSKDSGKDSCFGNFAIKYLDHAYCENILDESDRNLCYREFVYMDQNPELCSKITSSLNGCLTAIKLHGSEMIDRVKNMCDANTDNLEKEYCYSNIAYVTGDLESCKSSNLVVNCMLAIDKDKTHTKQELVEVCESMSDSNDPMATNSDKRWCYQELAIHLNDIEMCKLGWFMTSCVGTIDQQQNGKYSYDELYDYCELSIPLSILGKEYAVEVCRNGVIRRKNEDMSRCESDLTDSELKFFCYYYFAAHSCNNNDPTVCSDILDDEAKYYCQNCDLWANKYPKVVTAYDLIE